MLTPRAAPPPCAVMQASAANVHRGTGADERDQPWCAHAWPFQGGPKAMRCHVMFRRLFWGNLGWERLGGGVGFDGEGSGPAAVQVRCGRGARGRGSPSGRAQERGAPPSCLNGPFIKTCWLSAPARPRGRANIDTLS